MFRTIVGLALLAATAVPAVASDDIHPLFGYGGGPACDDWSVLARVTEKFSYQDFHVAREGLSIAGIDNIRQYEPKVQRGLVSRSYCTATAALSNGRKAEIAYLIEGPGLATFSLGWHVESCVVGHDPWRVYDAGCRSLRP
jgi:hypothetical protein